MAITPTDAQDVFKDAGENIIFVTQKLNRQDAEADKAAVTELAARIPAIINSMNIRYPDAHLRVAFGIGSDAWDYLFPNAPNQRNWNPSRQFQALNMMPSQPEAIFSSIFGPKKWRFVMKY